MDLIIVWLTDEWVPEVLKVAHLVDRKSNISNGIVLEKCDTLEWFFPLGGLYPFNQLGKEIIANNNPPLISVNNVNKWVNNDS